MIEKWPRGKIFEHFDSLLGLEGSLGVLGGALACAWGSLAGPWAVPSDPRGSLGGPRLVTFFIKNFTGYVFDELL